MKLIIDTNILISAFIRASTTRNLLLLSTHEFYYPDEALKEIEKYKVLIMEKGKITEENTLN